MKNFKKWFAALLSVILVMSLLVGCGEENTGTPVMPDATQDSASATTTTSETIGTPLETTVLPTEPDPVPPTEPTPDPTPTPAPGPDIFAVAATEETLELYTELEFVMTDGNEVYTFAMKEISEDLLVMYIVLPEGKSNINQYVVEMDQNNSLTGYYQLEKDGAFEKDTDDTRAQGIANLILTGVTGLLADTMKLGTNGETYELQADAAAKTGTAYVYKEMSGNIHTGNVWIDQATGFVVKHEFVENFQMKLDFEVTELITSDISLPQYK